MTTHTPVRVQSFPLLRRLSPWFALAAVSVAVLAPSALATPVVHWSQHSRAGVGLTITGDLVGGPDYYGFGANGHHTAPNGRWDLDLDFGSLVVEDDKVVFNDGFLVGGTYNGRSPFSFSTPGGFGDSFTSFANASSADGIFRWFPNDQHIGDGYVWFYGTDFSDLSTWKFTFTLHIDNPEFSTAVPDGGTTAFLAFPAVALLLLVGRFARNRSN
jgi:hypothetical protein